MHIYLTYHYSICSHGMKLLIKYLYLCIYMYFVSISIYVYCIYVYYLFFYLLNFSPLQIR